MNDALQSSFRSTETAIVFWYKNYKGEQGYRRAVPISIRYGTSDYHHSPQWLMLAFDTEKQAEREFAMADMSHNILSKQIVLRFASSLSSTDRETCPVCGNSPPTVLCGGSK